MPNRIIADHSQVMIAMAVAGAGLTFGLEAAFRPWFDAGLLRPVLLDHATAGPGCHIYYPSRRQLPTALRLFINLVRERQLLGL